MKTVDDYEKIRKAYYVEGLSMRVISRQLGHSRKAIRKALEHAEPKGYQRTKPHSAPKIAPYQSRIEELLQESEQMPRKQRYTGHKIYQLLQLEGYRGSESNLQRYVSLQRRARICRHFEAPPRSSRRDGRSCGEAGLGLGRGAP
jgi:transposase